ncbi:BTB/POZ domain-containing protein KCTD12 (Pfetin) (Predominantly fetal expressed T1 domain) [Durusdinium trenchii]|uniref:BTB/POZ domain-containing protein KCTD12 (Pfetin) (Predominantly fetal expressed T1 domain) n=2 Tax=Durusdinium trenchii TaxID=1381693 RepID=A0ABP0PNH6_9DINO
MELAQGEQKVSDSCQALKHSMEAVVEGIKSKREKLDNVFEERLKLSCSADGKDEKATAKGSDVLKLNVGGDNAFQTRRDTLTAIEGSRLSQMFGGRWDKVLPKDKSGRFFLDLDPQQFRALLSWLVDVKRTPPGSLEETEPPVESLPEEFRPGFLDLCRLLCSRDDLESESKKAEEEDTAAFSETLKTLREALDSTIKQGKMEMDESHADLVEKVMAVAQAALDYECTTRRQNRVLDAQQKAVDIEVDFMRQFLGRGTSGEREADIIRLNVSGVVLETFRSTLLFESESQLAAKFGEAWTMQSDEMVDGEVFFDEDPELFKLLMLHLRLKGLLGREFAPQIPAPKRGAWNRFTEYLNLEGMKVVDLVDTKLADSQKQLLLLQWLPLKKLKLLYRATQDGFAPANFHQKCDNRGPTVVLARSTGGYIFGGYTDAAWSSTNQYVRCEGAFLFRLCGPNASPSRHDIFQNHQHGISCSVSYLPVFGGGHDLQLQQCGSQGQATFSVFGHTYNASGTGGQFTFLAEAQTVTVDEIEVFGCSA